MQTNKTKYQKKITPHKSNRLLLLFYAFNDNIGNFIRQQHRYFTHDNSSRASTLGLTALNVCIRRLFRLFVHPVVVCLFKGLTHHEFDILKITSVELSSFGMFSCTVSLRFYNLFFTGDVLLLLCMFLAFCSVVIPAQLPSPRG